MWLFSSRLHEHIYTQVTEGAEHGELFCDEIRNFEFQPGVLHCDVHSTPNQCGRILGLCSSKLKAVKDLRKRIEDGSATKTFHISYQKFIEVAVDVDRTVLPMLQPRDDVDYVLPVIKSLLGLKQYLE